MNEGENQLTQDITDTSEWQKNLHRVIRRAIIDKRLSTKEVIKSVKACEAEVGVDRLITDLVNEEVIIDPKMKEVGNYVFQLVSQQFPYVQAIVLLGSLVHGGAEIRRVTETNKRPDFDWGIIANKPVTFDEGVVISRFVSKHMDEIKKKFGLNDDFHPCIDNNPSHYRGITVQSVDEMASYLLDEKPLDKVNPSDDQLRKGINIILFLLPSFPSKVNEQNRTFFIDALKGIAKQDKEKWRSLVDLTMKEWENVHNLSERHFYHTGRYRDDSLIADITKRSGSVMSVAIRELLESTVGE